MCKAQTGKEQTFVYTPSFACFKTRTCLGKNRGKDELKRENEGAEGKTKTEQDTNEPG